MTSTNVSDLLGLESSCIRCKNLGKFKDGETVCKAFPGGIPPEIWLGKNNHTKPYRGDHGIQFEKLQP